MTKAPDHITTAAKARAEAIGRNQAQRESLARSQILLTPTEVAGDYTAARQLHTTLGGALRPITAADLKTFRGKVNALGKKLQGGITARDIINMSQPIDRKRANTEIRSSIPMASRGGVMHFVTNSGPNSDVQRHHVFVEFVEYAAAIASPSKTAPVAKKLTDGRLRYRCDCGRFIFWYSYIATVGHFIYGDPQLNFPKIRNPNMVGVACKHSLRVMQQLSTPLIRKQVETMVERARAGQDTKVHNTTKKAAQALARQQEAKDIRARPVKDAAAKFMRKLMVAGLGDKKPQALKKLGEKPTIKEKQTAMQRQIAKLKNLGMTDKVITTMFAKFVKELTQ